MKFIQKIITITLCVCFFALTLTVFCGCDAKEEVDETKLQVVSTIFPGYDFAKQVGGENVQSWCLLSVGKESHSYEPTAKDIIKIQNCDLFIYVGGESDTWVDKILNSFSTPIKTVKMMDNVSLLDEEQNEDEHEAEHESDEHVWTSPVNAQKISLAIRDALCQIDSTNATIYTANCATYLEKLTNLNNDIHAFTDALTNKTMVIADRHPLAYFAEEYGFDVYAAFNGCSDETEPSTQKIKKLIDKVNNNNLTTVFYMEFSNTKTAQTVADGAKANVKLVALHACHNISKEDKSNGTTYIDIMYRNLNALKEAY